MRELSMLEVESVSGGNPFLLGVATGITANFIYDNPGVVAMAFPPYAFYVSVSGYF